MATMQKERLRPLAEAERRELVAIAKASSVLQLDPPAWKAGDQVKGINGRIYPLADGAQTIAHAGS
jgi:hypothetical protein